MANGAERRRRVFGHGDLRLYLLSALDEQPRHGYEIIRLLAERFDGLYSPSAGTVYPRLAALEEEGLIEHLDEEGRKVYRITQTGRRELHRRHRDVRRLQVGLDQSASDLAREIREQVTATVTESLRASLRQSMPVVRHSLRRSAVDVSGGIREALEATRSGPGTSVVNDEQPGEADEEDQRVTEAQPHQAPEARIPTTQDAYLGVLRAELDVFTSEVLELGRPPGALSRPRLRDVSQVLEAAQRQIAALVTPTEGGTGDGAH